MDYDIYFNSGESTAVHYTKGSNISLVEISNTDQEYYQTGRVVVYNATSSQSIGDSVMVFIDNDIEFNGYVSKRGRQVKGVIEDTYNLVGKTYDLWRYHTDSSTSYSDKTTCYVASSLVGTFCTGVDVSNTINPDSGSSITGDIEFNNEIIGDSLIRLTNLDGYRFYVDTDSNLHYEPYSDSESYVNITESDILDIQSIDEDDSDIVNDCIVVGGTDYSAQDNVSPNYPSSSAFPDDILIAQRFKARDHTLSAVKPYLRRTLDPFQPDELLFEIWENTEITLFDDDFENYTHLKQSNGYNITLELTNGRSNLVLSVCSTNTIVPVDSRDAYTNHDYHAQTFKNNFDFTVDYTKFWCQHNLSSKTGRAYILGTGATGSPDSANIFYSSMTSTITDTGFGSYISFYFDKASHLISGTTYAIVYGCPTYGDTTFTYFFGYSNDLGTYLDGKAFYSDDGTSWTSLSTRDLRCDIRCIQYYTSGQIESTSYTNDTQYMKLDIDGVVSSNHTYISGTNDSGTTWKTLTDDSWFDFDSESSLGTKVKYKFSSNGYYTPKIDSAELKISDESGGFDSDVLSDSFEDSSHINIAKSDSYYIDTDFKTDSLQISGLGTNLRWGNAGLGDTGDGNYFGDISVSQEDCLTMGDFGEEYLASEANCYDGDTATYGYDDFTPESEYKAYFVKLKFGNGNKYVNRVTSSWETYYTNHTTIAQYVSGSGLPGGCCTDLGWHRISNDYIYSGVSQVLAIGRVKESTDGHSSYFRYKEINPYVISSGLSPSWSKIVVNSEFLLQDTDLNFLKISAVTGGSIITFSGSLDSGNTWDKLDNNTWITMSTPGSGVKLMYVLDGTGFNYNQSASSQITLPYIESVQVDGRVILGGGNPKSGSKVEWSDDISWVKGDIPYPPSYSDWQTYSSPKLSGLTIGDNYWMIFNAESGSSKYWSYYYDPNSTYDGKISYSWDDGVSWSSNTMCPTLVPNGNMTFKLGWTQGEITATSSNQDSIDTYGRHFKKITDSNINTLSEANTRASREVSDTSVPKKGNVAINGTTDIELNYFVSSNLSRFGIYDNMDIISYTQTIDNRGFTTNIQFGKSPFDLSKKIADLERES